MQVEIIGSDTKTSAKGGAAFGAKIGAKSFWLLSSGIYSRKVLAVIREVSCNAYDAHIMSNQANRPIEVWLPTAGSPVFQVRDYGPGLSEEEVFTLYTTYFESNKDRKRGVGEDRPDAPSDFDGAPASEATGGFGLGSKSPFAITDQFTVTSVKDGRKTCYSCAVNHERVPETMKLWEGPADPDWPSGLMVTVPVSPSLIEEFKKEAVSAFLPFDVKPIFMGDANFELPEDAKPLATIGPLAVYSSVNDPGFTVRMARVDYKLDVSALNLTGVLKDFVDTLSSRRHKFILSLPAGAVVPAPSREALQYYKEAVAQIKAALTAAKTALADAVRSFIADVSCPKQDEIVRARQWLDKWLSPMRYLNDSQTRACFGETGLSQDALHLLVEGFVSPPIHKQDLDWDVYVYQWNKSQGRATRSKLLKGRLASEPNSDFLLMIDTPVYYAHGERADMRVRESLAARATAAAKSGDWPESLSALLVCPKPSAKVKRGDSKKFADIYARLVCAEEALPSSVLPDVKKVKPQKRAAAGASVAVNDNFSVNALILKGNFKYVRQQVQYDDVKNLPNVVVHTQSRGWSQWAYNASCQFEGLQEAAYAYLAGGGDLDALRSVLPDVVLLLPLKRLQTAGMKAAAAAHPSPEKFWRRMEHRLLEKLKPTVDCADCGEALSRPARSAILNVVPENEQKHVIEVLEQYEKPSALLRAVKAVLSNGRAYYAALDGVSSLVRILAGRNCSPGCTAAGSGPAQIRRVGINLIEAVSSEHLLVLLAAHEKSYQLLESRAK